MLYGIQCSEAIDVVAYFQAKKQALSISQRVCVTCGRTDSPEWRKVRLQLKLSPGYPTEFAMQGPLGPKTLCNACGLRWAKRPWRHERKWWSQHLYLTGNDLTESQFRGVLHGNRDDYITKNIKIICISHSRLPRNVNRAEKGVSHVASRNENTYNPNPASFPHDLGPPSSPPG